MFKPAFQLLIAVALFFGLWQLLSGINWMRIFKVEQRIKKSQGRIARDMVSKEISAMRVTTNNTTPTGGVTVPMIRFSTIMTPNCTGSMP